MSTQAAGAPRPQREFWPALGHHAWKAPLLVNGLLVTGLLFGWGWWLLVLVFAIYGVAYYAVVKHNHNLCERCIAEMPLNPQALVTRRDRALRWDHKEDRFRGRPLLLLLAIYVPLIVVIALFFLLPDWAGKVLFALWVGVYQTYEILATRTHKILQPWCPYCDHRRRGKDTFDPDPDPAPVPDPVEEATR